MDSVKKPAPRFHVGDWVSFDYGSGKMVAEVIEDRGPLGIRGRRLYRVQIDDQLTKAKGLHALDVPEGELITAEMPEEGLASVPTPARQAYQIQYLRQGRTKEWVATTKLGEIYHGVKAEGAVGYSAASRNGDREEDLNSASVAVLVKVAPRHAEPGAVVPDDIQDDMASHARALADEMFRSRHPRAKITHSSAISPNSVIIGASPT